MQCRRQRVLKPCIVSSLDPLGLTAMRGAGTCYSSPAYLGKANHAGWLRLCRTVRRCSSSSRVWSDHANKQSAVGRSRGGSCSWRQIMFHHRHLHHHPCQSMCVVSSCDQAVKERCIFSPFGPNAHNTAIPCAARRDSLTCSKESPITLFSSSKAV